MNKIFALSVLVISAISGTVVPAHAAYVVTATETDGDVVFEGSGSLDLTAWSFSGTTNRIGGLDQPSVLLGRFNAVPVDDYANASKFSGPSSIGSGSPFVRASSGSGDYTGLNPDAIALFVPRGGVAADPNTNRNPNPNVPRGGCRQCPGMTIPLPPHRTSAP